MSVVAWPSVALGEVVNHRKEFIVINDLETYRRPRVQLHAQGIVLRDAVPGALIKTKKQQVARAGEFLVAEIDAKVGGFGIVPADLDGSIVSSHYFLFGHNPDRINNRFLGWFIKTPTFRKQVEAQGSTNYAAIRPADVLGYKIPLPPLDEQRRIVARIEALTAKTEEAKALRREAQRETDASLAGAVDMHFTPSSDWRMSTVGQLCEKPQYGFSAPSTRDPVGPRLLRITDIQGGCVDWNTVPYCECSNPDTYLLREGDLVFARTGGTTGKSFIIRDCPDAIFASYLIRLRPTSAVSVEYLYWFFQSRRYWQQIQDGVRGTGQPNLNGTKLAALSIPLAPLKRQREIVTKLDALQAKMNAAKALQAETADELEAMLPAILDKAFKGNL